MTWNYGVSVLKRTLAALLTALLLVSSTGISANALGFQGANTIETRVPGSIWGQSPWGKSTAVWDITRYLLDPADMEEAQAQINYAKSRGQLVGAYLGFGGRDLSTGQTVASYASTCASLGTNGYAIDLDGNTTLDPDGNPAFNIMRPAWQDCLVAVSKRHIDAGVDWIGYDVAQSDVYSFDAESIAGFRSLLASQYSNEALGWGIDASTFDIADYLRSQGYSAATIGSVTFTGTTAQIMDAWFKYHRYVEYTFTQSLIQQLKAYKSDIILHGNRWDGALLWYTADLWDFIGGETYFVTPVESYPRNLFHPLYAWGSALNKGFMSWNDPDFYTESVSADVLKIHIAETVAGGAVVAPGDNDLSGHRSELKGYTDFIDSYRNQLTGTVQSEVGIWYNPGENLTNENTIVNASYMGTAQMLSDLFYQYGVVGQPGVNALMDPAEGLTLAGLQQYPAAFIPYWADVNETQAGVLMDYANGGGRLILSGLHGLQADLAGLTEGTWNTVGAGAIYKFAAGAANGDAYYKDQGRSQIRSSVETALTAEGIAPAISTSLTAPVNLFQHRLTDGSDAYHLVNFGGTASPVSAGKTLTFTPPDGATKVAWLTPGAGVQELTPTDNGGTWTVTLPGFIVWGVLKVGAALPTPVSSNELPVSIAQPAFDYEEWAGMDGFNLTYSTDDDSAVSEVNLWARQSTDNGATWSAWSIVKTEPIASSPVINGTMSHTPASEGTWQFFVQAVDDAGLTEPAYNYVMHERKVDLAAPGYVTSATETNGVVSGVWQQDIQYPSFTWSETDSGSGTADWFYSLASSTVTYAAGSVDTAALAVTADPSNPIIEGTRAVLTLRPRDRASNITPADNAPLPFIFKYGPRPVADATNISVTAGDAKLTVGFTNPAANYGRTVVNYREQGSLLWNEGPSAYGGTGATESVVVTGLTNGTAYELMVVTHDATDLPGDEVPLSGTYTPAVDEMAPDQPAGLDATAGNGEIVLSWNGNTEADLTAYKVYLSEDGGSTWDAGSSVGLEISYTVYSLVNGTTYTFGVSALDNSGNESSKATIDGTPVAPSDTQGPSPPTGLQASAGNGQVALTWNDNYEGDFARYTLWTSTDGTAWDAGINVGMATSYTVTGLTNGTLYYFTLSAFDTSGNQSELANPVAATPNEAGVSDETPPAVPTGVNAEAGNFSVTVTWTANSDSDLSGYKLYITQGGNPFGPPMDVGNVTTRAVSGLTNGTTYGFEVSAYDQSGNESDKSTQVTATPQADGGGGGGGDTTPPAVPTGVLAAPGNSLITVSWTAVNDEDLAGYKVYLSPDGGQSWWDPMHALKPDTSVEVDGLVNGTTYTVAVASFDNDNNVSANSDTTTVTPTDQVSTTGSPAAPTGLQATPGDGQVALGWSPNAEADVTGYKVRISADGGSAWGEVIDAAQTSYVWSGLTNNSSYTFAVAAVDADSNVSDWSTGVSATPEAPQQAPSISLKPNQVQEGYETAINVGVGGLQLTGTETVDVSLMHESVEYAQNAQIITDENSNLVAVFQVQPGLMAGQYTVAVTIDDKPELNATLTVEESTQQQPPTLTLTLPSTGVTAGSTVELTASLSDTTPATVIFNYAAKTSGTPPETGWTVINQSVNPVDGVYQVDWVVPAAGLYWVRADAVDSSNPSESIAGDLGVLDVASGGQQPQISLNPPNLSVDYPEDQAVQIHGIDLSSATSASVSLMLGDPAEEFVKTSGIQTGQDLQGNQVEYIEFTLKAGLPTGGHYVGIQINGVDAGTATMTVEAGGQTGPGGDEPGQPTLQPGQLDTGYPDQTTVIVNGVPVQEADEVIVSLLHQVEGVEQQFALTPAIVDDSGVLKISFKLKEGLPDGDYQVAVTVGTQEAVNLPLSVVAPYVQQLAVTPLVIKEGYAEGTKVFVGGLDPVPTDGNYTVKLMEYDDSELVGYILPGSTTLTTETGADIEFQLKAGLDHGVKVVVQVGDNPAQSGDLNIQQGVSLDPNHLNGDYEDQILIEANATSFTDLTTGDTVTLTLADSQGTDKSAFLVESEITISGNLVPLHLKAGLPGDTYWVSFTKGAVTEKGKITIQKTTTLTPERLDPSYTDGTVVASNFNFPVTDTSPTVSITMGMNQDFTSSITSLQRDVANQTVTFLLSATDPLAQGTYGVNFDFGNNMQEFATLAVRLPGIQLQPKSTRVGYDTLFISAEGFSPKPGNSDLVTVTMKDGGGAPITGAISNLSTDFGFNPRVEFDVTTGLAEGTYTLVFDFTSTVNGNWQETKTFKVTPENPTVSPASLTTGYQTPVTLRFGNLRDDLQDGQQYPVSLWDQRQMEVPGAIQAGIGTVVVVDDEPFVDVVITAADLPAGVYSFAFEFESNQNPWFVKYQINPNANVIITVTRGTELVNHAMVELRPAGAPKDDWSSMIQANTDSEGKARFELTPGAAYEVMGVGNENGFIQLNTPVTAPAEGADPLTLTVDIQTNVRLAIADEDGNPWAFGHVVITPDTGSEDAWANAIHTNSNENGYVDVSLQPGSYRVAELGKMEPTPRHVMTKLPFTVTEATSSDTPILLQLPKPNVVVTVADQNGTPLGGIVVQIRKLSETDPMASEWIVTDGTGTASARLEPSTAYVVVDLGMPGDVIEVGEEFTTPADDVTDPVTVAISLSTNVQATLLDGTTPLANAWVRLTGQEMNDEGQPEMSDFFGTTDSNGVLSMKLEAGIYTIVEIGTDRGALQTNMVLDVSSGSFTGSLTLPAPKVKITVYSDKAQTVPVDDAMLQIRKLGADPTDHNAVRWTETDSNGSARLDLSDGTWVLVDVGMMDGPPVSFNKEFTVSADKTVDLKVTVASAGSVQLLNEAGEAILDAGVTIRPVVDGSVSEDWRKAIFSHSNESGNLRISLQEGQWAITEINNPDVHIRTTIRFAVTADGVVDANGQPATSLQVPQSNFKVQVLQGTDPVAFGQVQIRPANALPHEFEKSIWLQTDHQGYARTDLQAGVYRLIDVGTRSGPIPVNQEFTIVDGQPTSLEISISPNVVSTVKDELGRPMPNTMVLIKADLNGQPDPDWQKTLFMDTNPAGVLSIKLAPGAYHVVELSSDRRWIQTDIPFTVPVSGTYTADIALPQPNVRIRVSNELGGVPRAHLQIRPANAMAWEWDKSLHFETDKDGNAFLNLTAGAQMTLVDVGTFSGVTQVNKSFIVPGANADALELEISLATNVQATVKDETGASMPFSSIVIKPDNGQGKPVADFQSAIFTFTDASGKFSLNLDPGKYYLVEVHNPLRDVSTELPFEVGPDGFKQALQLPTANVRVTVTNGAAKVARAMIQIRPSNALPHEWEKAVWASTDSLGIAQFRLTPGETYQLVDVGSPMAGVMPVNKRFTVPNTGTAEITVSLQGNVQATLRDENGTPIARAFVVIKPDDGSGLPDPDWDNVKYVSTGNDGTLSLNLDAGDYHVVEIGSPSGQVSTDIPFTVTDSGYTGDLLVPSPNVQITVKNGLALVARAWVNLRPADGPADDWQKHFGLETDLSGVASLKLKPGTEYIITDIYTPSGGIPLNKKITAPAEGAPALTLTINLQSTLTLTVLDENQTAFTNAWVTIFPEEDGQIAHDRPIHGNIDGSGNLNVNLLDGTYHLVEIGAGRIIRTDIAFTVTDGAVVGGGTLTLPQPNLQVTVNQGGQEVPFAMVQLRPANADPNQFDLSIWAQTDSQGVAQLRIAPDTDYLLVDIGYGPVVSINKMIRVTGSETKSIEIKLDAAVKLNLKDEQGAALTDAWARIVPDQDGQPAPLNGIMANAGMDGIASLSLPDGDYWVVEVGAAGRVVKLQHPFTVTAGAFDGDVQLPSANTTAMVTIDGTAAEFATVWVVEAQYADDGYAANVKSFQAGTDGVVNLVLEAGKSYVIKEVEAKASGGVLQRHQLATPLSFDAPVQDFPINLTSQ